jgi:hypothetical protein
MHQKVMTPKRSILKYQLIQQSGWHSWEERSFEYVKSALNQAFMDCGKKEKRTSLFWQQQEQEGSDEEEEVEVDVEVEVVAPVSKKSSKTDMWWRV